MSGRNAYSAARRAHSEAGALPCPSCGVEQPPEALQRREDGTIRRECLPCRRRRNNERMRRRRQEAHASVPPGHKACNKCLQVLPLERFDRRSDSAGYRTDCKRCRSTERAQAKRKSVETIPRADRGRWVPRTPGSALSEANIARDLYIQALRAFDLARSQITEEDYA